MEAVPLCGLVLHRFWCLRAAGCAAGRFLALGRVSHAGFESRVASTLDFSLREVIGAPGVVSKQGLHDM